MYCGYCRAELKGKEKFCPKCGKELPKTNIIIEVPGKSTKRICITVSILFAFLIACIAGVFYFRKNENSYLALVRDEDGKYGYIDEKGKEVISCKFDFASPFMSNGLAVFGEKHTSKYDHYSKVYKYGLINKNGDILVPAIYDDIDWKSCDYSNEMQYVSVAKQVDVDEEGNSILNWGWIDTSGQLVIECIYDHFGGQCWKNGICIVYKQGMEGIIDVKGNEIIPIGKYDEIGNISDDGLIEVGYSVGNDKNRWGVVDFNDTVIIPLEYDELNGFSDNGLIPAKKVTNTGEEKWGYINKHGAIVFHFQYEYASVFSNGLAFVIVDHNGKEYWGYMDKNGEIAQTNLCTDWIMGTSMNKNGKAVIYGNGQNGWDNGIVDSKGNEIVQFNNWHIQTAEYSRYGVVTTQAVNNAGDSSFYTIYDTNEDGGKYGLINANTGEIVISMSHDILWKGDNDWFLVGDVTLEGDDESDWENNEYLLSYVDEKGNNMLQLPDKYVFASEFVKMPEKKCIK